MTQNKTKIVGPLAFVVALATISALVIVPIVFNELAIPSRIKQELVLPHDNSIKIRRKLSTGIRIRIPPPELIEYINTLGTNDEVQTNTDESLLLSQHQHEQQQQSSFKVSASISNAANKSIGIATIENNLRGHGIITIKIKNMLQCDEQCTLLIQSGTSTSTCKSNTMDLISSTPSKNNFISHKISPNSNSNIDTQMFIKIGPTDDYSNHVIIIEAENSIVACGVFKPIE